MSGVVVVAAVGRKIYLVGWDEIVRAWKASELGSHDQWVPVELSLQYG